MKKIIAAVLLCLALSADVVAVEINVMYNTDIKITRLYTSTVIYPVFDDECATLRIKGEAYRLACASVEHILERALRGREAESEWRALTDTSVKRDGENIRVSITSLVYKNGLAVNMDIKTVYM